jgi:hypothetical protein
MKQYLAASVLVVLMGIASVSASTIPYNDPANQGTQAWGGNLALNFDVVSPVTVGYLGVFNAAGNGIIAGTIQVVIYDTTSHLQVTPVVTFHGSYPTGGLGFDVFQAITPVTLGVGSYQVDAVGFSGSDLNGNLNTGSSTGPVLNPDGGSLVFTGAGWDFSAVLDNPTTCSICQALPLQSQQFDAGTFAIVPELGTLTLLGSSLIAVAAFLRRKPSR